MDNDEPVVYGKDGEPIDLNRPCGCKGERVQPTYEQQGCSDSAYRLAAVSITAADFERFYQTQFAEQALAAQPAPVQAPDDWMLAEYGVRAEHIPAPAASTRAQPEPVAAPIEPVVYQSHRITARDDAEAWGREYRARQAEQIWNAVIEQTLER